MRVQFFLGHPVWYDATWIGRDTVAINHSKSRRLELFLVFVIRCTLVRTELEILNVNWSGQRTSIIMQKSGQRPGAQRKVANKLDVTGKAITCKTRVSSVMECACLSWMNAKDAILAQAPLKGRLSESLVWMKLKQ